MQKSELRRLNGQKVSKKELNELILSFKDKQQFLSFENKVQIIFQALLVMYQRNEINITDSKSLAEFGTVVGQLFDLSAQEKKLIPSRLAQLFNSYVSREN